MVDKDLLVGALESSKKDMYKFLRDIVAIPSESTQEEKVIQRIAEEMNKVGFDRVWTDPMGNLIGEIGSGERIIAFDAHIDTVGIGDLSAWDFDPYEGYEDEEYIGGRGTTDQKGGIAAMVYAGGMMKRLGLVTDYKILFVASVQEEDCDGLCWDYIISQDGIRPEFVVSTEPTNCQIYRGHRGRMEIKVQTKGISCHGSAPERGINAIYKMADIISEIEKLNDRLLDHPFLGKGTLTISEIYSNSPSRCAVADECIISIDRRLTFGETAELALEQIRSLPAVQAAQAVVEMYDYAKPSYTGLTYPTDCYFPAWAIEQEHVVTQSLFETFKFLFEKEPVVDKWTFSTNCVSIMGKYQIPCIGFGPGKEEEAHAPNEKTWKSHLDQCALMYTLIPSIYEKALLNSN